MRNFEVGLFAKMVKTLWILNLKIQKYGWRWSYIHFKSFWRAFVVTFISSRYDTRFQTLEQFSLCWFQRSSPKMFLHNLGDSNIRVSVLLATYYWANMMTTVISISYLSSTNFVSSNFVDRVSVVRELNVILIWAIIFDELWNSKR